MSISQKAIMKFVRHHQSLRWLRSDLSDENSSMLKQERPEVMFVTDWPARRRVLIANH